MNKKRLLVIAALATLLLTAAVAVSADGNSDLAQVLEATAEFHRSEAAQAAGRGFRCERTAEPGPGPVGEIN